MATAGHCRSAEDLLKTLISGQVGQGGGCGWWKEAAVWQVWQEDIGPKQGFGLVNDGDVDPNDSPEEDGAPQDVPLSADRAEAVRLLQCFQPCAFQERLDNSNAHVSVPATCPGEHCRKCQGHASGSS